MPCRYSGPENGTSQVMWFQLGPGSSSQVIILQDSTHGLSIANTSLRDRLQFSSISPIHDASITISHLYHTDQGRYVCRYVTFPMGNQEATTTLTVMGRSTGKTHTHTHTITVLDKTHNVFSKTHTVFGKRHTVYTLLCLVRHTHLLCLVKLSTVRPDLNKQPIVNHLGVSFLLHWVKKTLRHTASTVANYTVACACCACARCNHSP